MPPFHFSDDVEKKPLTWQYIRGVLSNFIHYYGPHIRLFWISIYDLPGLMEGDLDLILDPVLEEVGRKNLESVLKGE